MSNDNGDNKNNEGHFSGPVGKGNPPKSGQFKKGQSGNSKGRPKKGKSTFEDDVKEILNSKTQVKINGKIQDVTMRKLILQQVINEAVKMNPKALKYAMPLLKISDSLPDFEVLPEDEGILDDLMKNLGYDDES